ncbi:MAG: TIR domain-containing protein [Eubacterium sp.]|nr:TIR domain-containing protein [Eubacterium sp.]
MTILKCKMCGGELNIFSESSVCECEYCGSKQTIPNTDDEKRLKLYERANKLRYECEFDKASGVYESIVADYQSEAEAYWGMVLCKYGIEYVDDPKTGKKIPTCHRSSFDSVFDDANFDLVMENADSVAVDLYREEAKQIEELRKGILAVSSKEQPYDIFICYKETDENGDRTIDSVLAQNVYNELINSGYKVFFSRISLEDKLGKEYEPYIFSALNTAKVMLAFGTSYKNYNAVWVKNEWSRFLQLVEEDSSRVLIPCFKGIDAYDMPKEFAVLQAQDLGKVGATQDLLRGIDKIFGRDKKPGDIDSSRINIVGDGNALVKRGYFALEDREWEKAIEYFDQALNQDAENAEIHLGLFLAKRKNQDINEYLTVQINRLDSVDEKEILACDTDEERINRIAEENYVRGYLSKKEIKDMLQFDCAYKSIVDSLEEEKTVYNDGDWKKAERFSKGELSDQIQNIKSQHINEINDRIEIEKEKDGINSQKKAEEYKAFLDKYEKMVIDRRFNAESKREKDYLSLCDQVDKAETELKLNNIVIGFERLEGYKDSDDRILDCKEKIKNIQREEFLKAQERRIAKNKKIKRICIISVAIAILIVACFIGWNIYQTKVVIPEQKYQAASKLMKEQKYEEAIAAFEKLDNYKDSTEKIDECYSILDDIKTAEEKAEEEKIQKEQDTLYQSIIEMIDKEDFDGAIEEYNKLSDANYKTQAMSYMVKKIEEQLNKIGNTDIFGFKKVHENCLKVVELADEEQKAKLTELNDKKDIIITLSTINNSETNSSGNIVNNADTDFNDLIDDEKYKKDVEIFKEIYEINIRLKNVGEWYTYDDFVLKYDFKNHCFKVNIEDYKGYYIISYGSESLNIGAQKGTATHRISKDRVVEKLEIEEQGSPIYLFEDITLD